MIEKGPDSLQRPPSGPSVSERLRTTPERPRRSCASASPSKASRRRQAKCRPRRKAAGRCGRRPAAGSSSQSGEARREVEIGAVRPHVAFESLGADESASRRRRLTRRPEPSSDTRSGSGLARRALARRLFQSRFERSGVPRREACRTVEFGHQPHRIVDLSGGAEGAGATGSAPRRTAPTPRDRRRGRCGTESPALSGWRTPPSRRAPAGAPARDRLPARSFARARTSRRYRSRSAPRRRRRARECGGRSAPFGWMFRALHLPIRFFLVPSCPQPFSRSAGLV